MVALKLPETLPAGDPAAGPAIFERKALELWACPLVDKIFSSASSPILAGDTVYAVAEAGDLFAVDANSGAVKWRLKLGIEERNSWPLFADGRLYVPMLDDPVTKGTGEAEAGTAGAFYIIEPGENEGRVVCHAVLDGRCFGTPVAYNGRLYLQTTRQLYCWGKRGDNPGCPAPPAEQPWPAAGPATQLQVIPSEVLLHPGERASFRVRSLDANGFTVQESIPQNEVKWASYIPPTARVKAALKGAFNEEGGLVAAPEPVLSAGAFEATVGPLKGYIRGRVMAGVPYKQDFESFALSATNAEGTAFAYPPLPWIGARFKFDVREKDGNKVLAKTTDNRFFQRATVFIGTPDMSRYTIQADVMSEGNRRKMSEVGIINQRYLIVLKGNEQKLEVNSNQERLREGRDFKWAPNVWYRLKARVDREADGSAGCGPRFGSARMRSRRSGRSRSSTGRAMRTARRGCSRSRRKTCGFILTMWKSRRIEMKLVSFPPRVAGAARARALGAALSGFLVLSALAARAQDWPQWGGTQSRNMYSPTKGLPDRFTRGKPAEVKFKPGTDEVDCSNLRISVGGQDRLAELRQRDGGPGPRVHRNQQREPARPAPPGRPQHPDVLRREDGGVPLATGGAQARLGQG